MICSSKLASISVIIVSLAGHSLLFAAEGPSFDCAKAATWSEKAVCSDAVLARAGPGRRIALSRGQVARDACGDGRAEGRAKGLAETSGRSARRVTNPAACLLNVYRKRVEALAAWAGRTPPKSREAESRSQGSAAATGDHRGGGVGRIRGRACMRSANMATTRAYWISCAQPVPASRPCASANASKAGRPTFRELGAVDVVGWVVAFAANIIPG